jgi:hypothetical protein
LLSHVVQDNHCQDRVMWCSFVLLVVVVSCLQLMTGIPATSPELAACILHVEAVLQAP